MKPLYFSLFALSGFIAPQMPGRCFLRITGLFVRIAMFDREYNDCKDNRLHKKAPVNIIPGLRPPLTLSRLYSSPADMINAPGRRIAGQCLTLFSIAIWLGGNNDSPSVAMLFEFSPTEKNLRNVFRPVECRSRARKCDLVRKIRECPMSERQDWPVPLSKRLISPASR